MLWQVGTKNWHWHSIKSIHHVLVHKAMKIWTTLVVCHVVLMGCDGFMWCWWLIVLWHKVPSAVAELQYMQSIQLTDTTSCLNILKSDATITWLSYSNSTSFWQLKSSNPALTFNFWAGLQVKSACSTMRDNNVAWIARVNQRIGKIDRSSTSVWHLWLVPAHIKSVYLIILLLWWTNRIKCITWLTYWQQISTGMTIRFYY